MDKKTINKIRQAYESANGATCLLSQVRREEVDTDTWELIREAYGMAKSLEFRIKNAMELHSAEFFNSSSR